LLVVIMAAHAWAVINAGYFYVWWLDIVLHFAGGFWLASLSIFILWGRYAREFPRRPLLSLLTLVSLVSLGGVVWEFFEFGYDVLLAVPSSLPIAQMGQSDTMSDLFLDLSGAATAHWFFLKNNQNQEHG
ncbi:MAG: hypothetical protein AAB846_00185, partial [Patescibacteria group bacterium]